MDKKELNTGIEKMLSCAELLSQKGWAEAGSGNISILIDLELSNKIDHNFSSNEKPLKFKTSVNLDNLENRIIMITNSGSRMRSLKEAPERDISIVKILRNKEYLPVYGSADITSERGSHLGLYNLFIKTNRAHRAVIHIHPPEIIAFSHLFKDEEKINSIIKQMLQEIEIFLPEGVGFIEYYKTGSDELAEATVKKFEKYKIAIWERHGVIASGKNLDEALDYIEMLNKALKVYFLIN